MGAKLHSQYARLITTGGQVLLLLVAIQIQEWRVTLGCFSLVALISLLVWLSALRRGRAIGDTPTSRVASAAQGQVELLGYGKPDDSGPILSPLRPRPCLWYRYRIERRDGNSWRTEESGESEACFVLDDGTGQCTLDPHGAEILPRKRETWTEDDRRYSLWLLLPDAPLYALGEFVTVSGITPEEDIHERIKELLSQWKEDRPTLLARFDLDGNGELDMREWELARRQARREVAAEVRQAESRPALNLMRQPKEGYYLISDIAPNDLAHRYRLWAFFHLMVFLACLWALGHFLTHGF
ncbi:MAG: hypothetical protein PHU46_06290 [Rhodocyclaceae bacterium]|nr:hypothetical protein [Rhodocyclaceae bacterium]